MEQPQLFRTPHVNYMKGEGIYAFAREQLPEHVLDEWMSVEDCIEHWLTMSYDSTQRLVMDVAINMVQDKLKQLKEKLTKENL